MPLRSSILPALVAQSAVPLTIPIVLRLIAIFCLCLFFCGGQSEGAGLTILEPLLSCVGSGHAELSLRADWRQQLALAHEKVGFGAVRFHGILDDDMSTFLNGEANMFNVFQSYDWLVSLGMKPIVELSFMPQLLALNSSHTVFHYQGGTSQPANWTQWSQFIGQFASLLVGRYGLDEVAQWKFEVWNEPNCGFLYPYGQGCCPTADCGPQDLYFKLYTVTSTALKAVSPRLQVGGPATAQTGWLPDFLHFVSSTRAPIDFVSTHLYPTDPNVPASRLGFADTLAAAAQQAASIGVPLVVTEFNAGLGINAADGPYAASFIAHQLLAFQNTSNIANLCFWTFSDIFEEQGFISAPYSEQFGMLNIYNVPKPVFSMYEILNTLRRAGDLQVQSLATQGTVDTLVLSAPQPLNCYTLFGLATNFQVRNLGPIKTEQATITFSGLLTPSYVPTQVSVTFIDDLSGFAKPVWEAAGQPTYPSQAQVDAELLASVPRRSSVPLVLSAPNTYSLTVSLLPWATAFAQVSYCGTDRKSVV